MRILAIIGVLAFATTAMAANLTNGDFEGGFYSDTSGDVGNNWTYYRGGNTNGGYGATSEVTGDGGSGSAQNIWHGLIRDDRWMGVRQTVDANIGDAFTFSGRVKCDIRSYGNTGIKMALRAHWSGGTDRDAASEIAVSYRPTGGSTWYDTGEGAGNATGTSVTLFCDNIGVGGKIATNMTWDNLVAYRAHVPPASAVGGETNNTLDVDVDAGGNAGNANAEFAIVINGGGLTDQYVQTDGSVGGSAAWQTEALWGTETVTGLNPGTQYTFEVIARYSSTITQETVRVGNTASGTTTPEPGALAFLALGLPFVLHRRRRS